MINEGRDVNMFNITHYCEYKLSKHERESDPDVNFYNNLNLPMSNYYDLENLDNYFEALKPKLKYPFNIMHINCRSLYNKINELKLLTKKFKANIIALTETWLEAELANIISIPEYTLVHKARNKATRGGGVGFMIKNDLNFEEIEIHSPEITTFEYIAIKIQPSKHKNIILLCIYRPPGTSTDSFNAELDKLLNSDALKKRIIIMGDFNIDLLKAESHEPSEHFINMMLANSFIPTINHLLFLILA